MIDLEYTYISANNIFKDIVFIKDFEAIWYIAILVSIIFWIVLIMYVIPMFYSIKDTYKKNKEKESKSLLLKQIIMQKELEDEILKEVKKH